MIIAAAIFTESGLLITGIDHDKVLSKSFEKLRGEKFNMQSIEGFITDKGIKLNRARAQIEAEQCGQVPKHSSSSLKSNMINFTKENLALAETFEVYEIPPKIETPQKKSTPPPQVL